MWTIGRYSYYQLLTERAAFTYLIFNFFQFPVFVNGVGVKVPVFFCTQLYLLYRTEAQSRQFSIYFSFTLELPAHEVFYSLQIDLRDEQSLTCVFSTKIAISCCVQTANNVWQRKEYTLYKNCCHWVQTKTKNCPPTWRTSCQS